MDKAQLQEMLLMEITGNRQRTDTIQLQMKTLDEQAKLISDLGEKLKRKLDNEKFLIAACNRNAIDISKLPYPLSISSGSQPPAIERKASLKKPKPGEKPQAIKPANLLEKYTSQSYAAPSAPYQQARETPNGKVMFKKASSTKSRSIGFTSQSGKSLPSMKRLATITLPSESPVLKNAPHLKASITQTVETASERPLHQTQAPLSPPIAPVNYFTKPVNTIPVPRYDPEFNAKFSKSFEANGRHSPQLDAPVATPVMSASINSSAKVKITNPNFGSISTPFTAPLPINNSNGHPQKPLLSNLDKYSSPLSQTPAKEPLQPHHVLNETPTTETSSPVKSLKEAETPIPVRSESILWTEFLRQNFPGSGQMQKKQKMRFRAIILSFLETKGYTIKNTMMWDEKHRINDVALPEVFVEDCYEFVVDRMKLNKPKYVLDEEDIKQISGDREAKRRRKDVDYDLDKIEKMNSLK